MMPIAENNAAASDHHAARRNCRSMRNTPIAARIIDVKMKPRSSEIMPWIARLPANAPNPDRPPRGAKELPLDEKHADRGEDHRREDEAALERDHAVDRETAGERAQSGLIKRFSRGAESGLDHQQPPRGERGEESQRDRERMLLGRLLKRLRGDDNADVEQNADAGLQRDEVEHGLDRAREADERDEDAVQRRIAGALAQPLPAGMADIEQNADAGLQRDEVEH